ncbi:hypothetical protein SCLCIDRAFT_145909 [Scleroderma citrinum Foug A]|uniref:Uncharacterized protein n=1 Tax=Scleroderma citrinum Foug A TaxID=1036808 RepID=A0A0C3D2E4_9AGAM|nr:hypothetical protein SCLCIDRAFT_145909 [Scleroderma citrinum Foug A]
MVRRIPSYYCHISRNPKECALHLWDSGWELEDLYLALGVSSRSCFCRRQTLEEDGSVNRPP